MKKIILSLATIVLIIGVVAGGTWAYYSATKTSVGNVFAAGDLTIALSGTNNENNPIGGQKRFFDVQDMFPGDIATAYVEIKNTSDRDIIFGFTANNVESTPADFIDQLIIQVTLRPSGYPPVLDGTPYGTDNLLIGFDDGYTIRDLRDGWLHNIEAAFEDGWPLKPDYLAVYKVEVKMPFETGNAYQSAELTADLEVKGVQFDNWDDKDHAYTELGW